MQITVPSVALEWVTPQAEEIIERAGRTCYRSDPQGSPAQFIAKILKRGHESVLEHASASFRIVTDRGVTHELVRHRLASYSQESTRFCNYGKTKFGSSIALIPMLDGLTPAQILRRQQLYEQAEAVYLAELAEGIAPQQARDNLPTCLRTEIVMTQNFRTWRHFLRLRTAPAAHPQMRKVANAIRDILQAQAPAVFGDLTCVSV